MTVTVISVLLLTNNCIIVDVGYVSVVWLIWAIADIRMPSCLTAAMALCICISVYTGFTQPLSQLI